MKAEHEMSMNRTEMCMIIFYCNAPLVYRSYCKWGTTKLMIMIMIMMCGIKLNERKRSEELGDKSPLEPYSVMR